MAVKSFQARLTEYDEAAQNEFIKNQNAKRKLVKKDSIGNVSNFEVGQGELKKIDEKFETIQKEKEIKLVKLKAISNVSPIGAVEKDQSSNSPQRGTFKMKPTQIVTNMSSSPNLDEAMTEQPIQE